MKLAVLATGALMAMTGAGVAAADDAPNVVGKTYGDASSALSDAGFTPKVATTVGDKTDRSACMVTGANPAPFVGGTDASHVEKTMLLNLNCYATPASANTSGYSVSNNSAGAQAVREANAAQQAQSEANVTAENDR